VKRSLLLPLLVLALLLGACGDDGGETADPETAGTTPPSETTGTTGTTVVGPTEGGAACADLADRYVQRARALFETQGTPPDALVDRVRARLTELDAIAATAGCGPEYVTGVCDGLDALSQEGVLVLYPLTTAQCL
jgi:hypothetical protein